MLHCMAKWQRGVLSANSAILISSATLILPVQQVFVIAISSCFRGNSGSIFGWYSVYIATMQVISGAVDLKLVPFGCAKVKCRNWLIN